jgi:hypothetical protein
VIERADDFRNQFASNNVQGRGYFRSSIFNLLCGIELCWLLPQAPALLKRSDPLQAKSQLLPAYYFLSMIVPFFGVIVPF